jgi:hypothetical protein
MSRGARSTGTQADATTGPADEDSSIFHSV